MSDWVVNIVIEVSFNINKYLLFLWDWILRTAEYVEIKSNMISVGRLILNTTHSNFKTFLNGAMVNQKNIFK